MNLTPTHELVCQEKNCLQGKVQLQKLNNFSREGPNRLMTIAL
jgi:hypothetical protein